ncbi:probable glutamate receptor [Penaeus chinensis]|uniref:probable glutamate receptor n=1 Tax=Penaeus chinensis TaxID=139456 RepID=UPI001FB83B4A|nr:probable glutamate receptor [Penaeus chinensis]
MQFLNCGRLLLMLPPFLILSLDMKSLASRNIVPSMGTPDFHLESLRGIVEGPLAGWNAVFYLDPSLEAHVWEYVRGLLVGRNASHVLVDLGSDGALWSEEQPLELLRGAFMVHVVVFQNDPRPFFEAVSLQWNPQYLLFFSVSNETKSNLLLEDTFKGIERLLLVEKTYLASSTSKLAPGMFTSFPFEERKIKPIGSWSNRKFVSREDLFVDRFESFRGYEFQLGTWLDDYPYLYQSKTKPEGYGDGLEVEMLDAMANVLDYKYNLTKESPDMMWGAFENGSWNGMLGMVHRKEKNFTVNYFVITGERIDAFDATVSYWMEGFGISLMSPPPLPKWRGAYYPFTSYMWFYLAVTFVIVLIIMSIQVHGQRVTDWIQVCEYMTKYRFTHTHTHDILQPEPFLRDVGSTWPYLLRAMFNNSIPRLPKAQWQRLFVGSWWLYCFIVTTAYTANLIAFLTIPVFPARIQTVQQLAESDYRYDPEAVCLETGLAVISGYTFALNNRKYCYRPWVFMFDYGEFVPGALKTSKDPYYRALGDKLDLFQNYNNSVFPMLDGTYAYIESFSYNRILVYVEYEVENSYMLREQLYPGHLCWYFQKNTAWKYKFDHGIRRLVESGLIAHWIKVKTEDFLGRDFDRKQKLRAKEREKEALSLDHLQGVFFILAVSWAAGLLVFAGEVLRHRFELD